MTAKIRLTVVMTHPIQYYAPWFRFIANEAPELELTVLYLSEPSPRQQGAEFGCDFEWDVPLKEGYAHRVLRSHQPGHDFGSDRFWGIDVPEVGEAIEQSTPDVVLLSGWHSVSLVRAIFACRRRGTPLLYRGDTHLAGRDHGKHLLWWMRTRWLLSRFDRYLSVGVRVREYLRSFDVPDALVHDSPHCVDNEFFAKSAQRFREPNVRAEARSELGISGADFVVLFVGKLEPKKRPDDLLRALALMEKSPVLVVVGSGPMEAQCREIASNLGVSVRWCGFLNQTELGRAYAISDCLVLPSGWGETWGLVINESMAAGLPCVVSDRVGCAPDLVLDGETGETFPFGDGPALARALERVRSGANRASACQNHAGRFSFHAATDGLVAACRKVVG